MRNTASDAEDEVIIRAMIGLAHNFQLTVTAQGVETQAQLELLRELGCDHGQGYLLSPPEPLDAFTKRLKG